MEDLGEKMKTHVSKISPRSWALFYPSVEVKSHKDLRRWNTQNTKMGFSPWIISITMNSFDRELFETIFSFEIRWAETKIMWFEDFGRQPN